MSRVPQVSKQAKEFLSLKPETLIWKNLENGYQISPTQTTYKGMKQRWLLVSSKQAHDRELKTVEKNIASEGEMLSKKLWHLGNQEFKCATDANIAAKIVTKSLKNYVVKHRIEKVLGYSNKGRPQKDAVKDVVFYRVRAESNKDEKKIAAMKLRAGRFILATNQFDEIKLPDEDMLKEYKEQIHTEAGFRFIKNDAFEVSSVFLKKETRIQALAMVMTLSLMVYNLAQHFLRNALINSEDTVPNQVGKQIKNPTFSWVCRMFNGVQVFRIKMGTKTKELVVNVTDVLRKIILYFGVYAAKIYDVSA